MSFLVGFFRSYPLGKWRGQGSTEESKMDLNTPVNPDIPVKAVFAITHTTSASKITFFWTIVNGWQRRHASVEVAAKWQYPHLNITGISRFR